MVQIIISSVYFVIMFMCGYLAMEMMESGSDFEGAVTFAIGMYAAYRFSKSLKKVLTVE